MVGVFLLFDLVCLVFCCVVVFVFYVVVFLFRMCV